jgi:hypothetical protein
MLGYIRIRTAMEDDWLRLALILGAVALVNFATILVFRASAMKKRYGI